MAQKKIYIGTSGWYDEHWSGIFYGEAIAAEDRLIFYSEHFDIGFVAFQVNCDEVISMNRLLNF